MSTRDVGSVNRPLRSLRRLRAVAFAVLLAPPLAAQVPPRPSPAPPAPPAAETTPEQQAEAYAPAGTPLSEIAPVMPGQQPPAKGLQVVTGDYTWKFGGYIKVDAIHDFDQIGNRDAFDVRTIPTTGSTDNGSNTRIHARQTRFNLDVRGPGDPEIGEFHAFVEGDFFGDGNSFRLRHAYGELGPILGGQTWTTFMDEDAMPETLDFETPVAYPMIRQGQIRWTQKLDDGDYWAVALEDPDSDIIAPAGVPGEAKEPLPDLAARVRWNNARGHVQLGLFAGMARFSPDDGSADDVGLWGLNLSTKLETVGDDSAIVQLTYGDGVGRYRGGVTAAPDADGNLEAVPIFGALLSYQHYWNTRWRSSLGYSWADADLPAGTTPGASENLTYGYVNLIRQITARCWAGVEYLHGTRETFDDASGSANRVQLSIRFDI